MRESWLVVVSADGLGSISAVGFASQEAGYRTCLVTNIEHARSARPRHYDEVVYEPHVYDTGALGAAIDSWGKGKRIIGVLSCSDGVTLAAAENAAAMGLPHPNLLGLRHSHDKYGGRLAERRHGMEAPPCALIVDEDDVSTAGEIVGTPAVLKPVYGVASHLVNRIYDPTELLPVYQDGRRKLLSAFSGRYSEYGSDGCSSPRDSFILERVIPGTEYTADAIVRNGEVRPVLLVEKVDVRGDRINPPAAVWPAFASDARTEMIWNSVSSVIAAYHIDQCLVNVDVIANDDQCVVVDVNAGRFGGRMINRLACLATGVHLDRELVALHSGMPSPTVGAPRLDTRVAMLSLRASGAGRIVEICGLREFGQREGVVDVTEFYVAGDYVRAVAGRQVTVAALLVKAESHSAVSDAFEDMMKSVEIVFEP